MYRAVIDNPNWSVGDKPSVTGKIYLDGASQDSGEIAFVTVRMFDNTAANILPETFGQSTATGFQFDFPDALTESYGLFFVAVFPDAGATATINGATLIGATSISLTITAGELPEHGWMLLNSAEVVEFTKTGASTATITRGKFRTDAAAYSGGEAVKIAQFKETCQPQYKYAIQSDDRVHYTT